MQEYPQIVSLLCFVKNSPTENSDSPVELFSSSICNMSTVEERRALLAKARANPAPYEPVAMDTTGPEPQPKKKETKSNDFVVSGKMLAQYDNGVNELKTLGVDYYPLNYERQGGVIHSMTFQRSDANVIVNDSLPYSFRMCREGDDGAPSRYVPRPQADLFMITLGFLNQVKYPGAAQESGEIPYHYLELDILSTGIAKALVAPIRDEAESEQDYETARQAWASDLWIDMGGQCHKDFDSFYKGIIKSDKGDVTPTAQPDYNLHAGITDIKAVIGKELGETSGKRHLQIALALEYRNYGKNFLPNARESYEENGKTFTRDVSGFTQFAQRCWANEIRHRESVFPDSRFPDPETPPRLNLYVESATRNIETDFFNYIQQHPEEKGKMKKMGLLKPKNKNPSPSASSAGNGAKRPRTGGEGTEEPAAKSQATGSD